MSAGATTLKNPVTRPHWSPILPRAPLPEALAICLDLIGSERYERAAITWHTRFCAWAPDLTFSDAQAVMAALAALPGPKQATAAAQLAELSRRHGLGDVADFVEGWLAARPLTFATRRRPGASQPPRRFTPRGHHPTAA